MVYLRDQYVLPSYRGSSGQYYTKTYKPTRRGPSANNSPWLLLLFLACGSCGMVYTLRSSAAAAAGVDATAGLRGRHVLEQQEAAGGAGNAALHGGEVAQQKWSERHVSDLTPEQVAALHAAAAASHDPSPTQHSFDLKLHQQWLDLPMWPEATEAELRGGWNLTQTVYDYAADLPGAKVLSRDAPRLVHFRSFLSPDEVDHFITTSQDKLTRSEVLSASNESVDSSRTSFGVWPERDEVVLRVQERIHRLVGVPERFGEDIYVLNYKQGQRYEAHNDHCMDRPNVFRTADPACREFLTRSAGPACGPGKGGPSCGDRVATFIMVFKAPTKGGWTVFPEAALTKSRVGTNHAPEHDWYCQQEGVLGARPEAGDALLFWDYKPGHGAGTGSYEDGTAQSQSEAVYEALHSGCPVLEGEKWIGTRWIRGSGFDYFPDNWD